MLFVNECVIFGVSLPKLYPYYVSIKKNGIFLRSCIYFELWILLVFWFENNKCVGLYYYFKF